VRVHAKPAQKGKICRARKLIGQKTRELRGNPNKLLIN